MCTLKTGSTEDLVDQPSVSQCTVKPRSNGLLGTSLKGLITRIGSSLRQYNSQSVGRSVCLSVSVCVCLSTHTVTCAAQTVHTDVQSHLRPSSTIHQRPCQHCRCNGNTTWSTIWKNYELLSTYAPDEVRRTSFFILWTCSLDQQTST